MKFKLSVDLEVDGDNVTATNPVVTPVDVTQPEPEPPVPEPEPEPPQEYDVLVRRGQSIQNAINRAGNNDTIAVEDGEYGENIYIDKPLTLMALNKRKAHIKGVGGWNVVSINSNYVTIDGFEISNGNGDGIEANDVHHITIRNCHCHNNGESGIQTNWAEFITIDNNICNNNASSGWFSGISLYQNRNIANDNSFTGFRAIVTNNICYENFTYEGAHTDGNGIIIDDFQSTQNSNFPEYNKPTLVENNLCYRNGGKGIQVVWSDNVTVRNNTTFKNNLDPLNEGTWRGDLSNSQSSNNKFINNIAVCAPNANSNNTAIDNTSYGNYKNTNVLWEGNMTWAGRPGFASVRTDGGNSTLNPDKNYLGVAPNFKAAPQGDFTPSNWSPDVFKEKKVGYHAK